jgi:hypothetical protein
LRGCGGPVVFARHEGAVVTHTPSAFKAVFVDRAYARLKPHLLTKG